MRNNIHHNDYYIEIEFKYNIVIFFNYLYNDINIFGKKIMNQAVEQEFNFMRQKGVQKPNF